jgi:hypothetical protein
VSANFVDRGVVPGQYRSYAVAGTPHLSDPLVPHPIANRTTPAGWLPALRAHFLQGDTWVRAGTVPPPSHHLKTSDGATLDRDGNGNAISVDAKESSQNKCVSPACIYPCFNGKVATLIP